MRETKMKKKKLMPEEKQQTSKNLFLVLLFSRAERPSPSFFPRLKNTPQETT